MAEGGQAASIEHRGASMVALLRGFPAMRRLWGAQVVSVTGDWLATVALSTAVYLHSGSALRVALVLVAGTLPALVASPWLGRLADRRDERGLMIAADLARAVAGVGLALCLDHFAALLLLRACFALAGGLFTPARQRILTRLVPPRALLGANALGSVTHGLMAVAGAALGGLLTASVGAEVALALDAATFAASAWLLRALPRREAPEAPPGPTPRLLDGLRAVRRTPVVRRVVLAGVSWGFVGGALQVLVTIYGLDVFSAGAAGLGALHAVQGLGMVLGGALVGSLAPGRPLRVFVIAYVGQAAAFALFVCTGDLLTGCVALFAMRVCGGVVVPLDATLLQRHAPRGALGQVLALHGAVYGGVMQLSMALAGALMRSLSPTAVGLGFAAVGLLAALALAVGGVGRGDAVGEISRARAARAGCR